ncbi:hypothetical protein GCM10023335_01620 [Streptomyces siamensis]|uniref:Uncharacterized protein n=1 Tax=Streptomyces siamensis TaxID=1274986 RepID=A0ABP9IB05_9ACTN
MSVQRRVVEVHGGGDGPTRLLNTETETAGTGEEVDSQPLALAEAFKPPLKALRLATVRVWIKPEVVAAFKGYAVPSLLHSTALRTHEMNEHQEITDALVEARIPAS